MKHEESVFEKNCGDDTGFTGVLIVILSYLIAVLFTGLFGTSHIPGVMGWFILFVIRISMWTIIALSISRYYTNEKFKDV